MKTILLLPIKRGSNGILRGLILSFIVIFCYLIITPLQMYGQQQSPSIQSPNQNYEQYESSDHTISIEYPANWKATESNNTIKFSSAVEDSSDPFREELSIEIIKSSNIPLNEKASLDIIALRQSLQNFSLTYADTNFQLSNHSAYKIIYRYVNESTTYQVMKIWTVIGRETYVISYNAELDRFDAYLPLIEEMLSSFKVEAAEYTNEHFVDTGGLGLRENPYAITVDASKNRIYTTNFRSGTVSVIDGQRDTILPEDIKVGIFPSAIAVDPGSSRLFVTNRDSNTVSVIDGSTNTVIANTSVGAKPVDVVIDSEEKGIETLIFVSNSYSNTVSVIDGSNNKVIANIEVKGEPVDLAVNSVINRLYVATYQNNTVSVIDYYLSNNEGFKNEIVANIQVGRGPSVIDFNPRTNRLYVSNSYSNTVSVIDGSTNTVIANIDDIGIDPYGIAINTDKNLIYVSNYLSNTVSVIDGPTNTVNHNISVNRFPAFLSYNPVNGIIYVTHLSLDDVTMINNTYPVIGVTFEVNPANSGYVNCNGNNFSNGDYSRYNISMTLDCLAIPNARFSFSSWSGDLTSRPINSSQATFNVSTFGNVTADFVIPIEFTLPKEYWEQLNLLLLSVIIPAIFGWSIPAIFGWINGKRQRRYLRKYMSMIRKLNRSSNSQDTAEYLRQLEHMRNRIERALAKGRLSESHYQILNNKISEGLESKK